MISNNIHNNLLIYYMSRIYIKYGSESNEDKGFTSLFFGHLVQKCLH